MVTGATGGYGRLALRYIESLAPEVELYGLVRNNEQAKWLEAQGIKARLADYADVEALTQAFEGIDRLLFVSVPIHELQINVVEAAKRAGVSYIAYTSLYAPEYHKGGLELNHLATEELIRATGIPHVFLRNSWYLEVLEPSFRWAERSQRFWHYADDKPITAVLKREYAEAGARVILDGSYRGALELTSRPYSYRELAELSQGLLPGLRESAPVSKEVFMNQIGEAKLSELDYFLITYYRLYG